MMESMPKSIEWKSLRQIAFCHFRVFPESVGLERGRRGARLEDFEERRAVQMGSISPPQSSG
jgi:hypothetical protein